MAELDTEDRSRAPNGGVRQAAGSTLDAAGSAVSDTAGTAKQQARAVGGEAKVQARNLVTDARLRMRDEARTQNDRLADSVRRFADELDQMAGERGDSPAGKMVTQVSQGGRRVADYLAEHGPEGVLAGVQDFARRRPGTFLAVAAAAGFVVGRLGKGVFDAEPDTSRDTAYGRYPVAEYTGTEYTGSDYTGSDYTGSDYTGSGYPAPQPATPMETMPPAPAGLASEPVPVSTAAGSIAQPDRELRDARP